MLVTVIIRTYHGRERLLARALESVKQQTGQAEVETIVVVDGPCDIDMDIISSSRSENTRIIRLGKQSGRSIAANAGLDDAKGQFVNFLDDDDWFENNHIQVLVERLNASPDAIAAYSAAWQLEAAIDAENPSLSRYGERTRFFYERASSLDLLDINLFPIQAVMFRRSIIETNARFSTKLNALEDWSFWQKTLIGQRIVAVNATTSTFLIPLNPSDTAKRVKEHEAALKAFYKEQKTIRVPLTSLIEASSSRRNSGRRYRDSSNFHSSLKMLLIERQIELSSHRTTLEQSIEYRFLTAARAAWVGVGRPVLNGLSKILGQRGVGRSCSPLKGSNDRLCANEIKLSHPFFRQASAGAKVEGRDVIFTVCNWRYIDKAVVLADSCKLHMPGFQFHLLMVDADDEDRRSLIKQHGSIDHVSLASDLPIFTANWAFMHTVVELSTAVKPFYLNFLLKRKARRAIYLDPDTLLLAPLNSALLAIDRSDVALTPHLYRPATSSESIATFEISALAHGIFNLGFFACRNSEKTLRVANYWQERCQSYCFSDVPRGLFTDQKWFDHVPVFFEGIEVISYPGVNTAVWNMEGRSFTRKGDKYFVDRQPLEMFHFSGWDKGTPEHFAKSLIKGGAGRHLLADYKGRVERNRSLLPRQPWIYGLYADGSEVTQAQRTCYRRHRDLQEAFPNPFLVGPQTYHDWVHSEGLAAIEDQYDESVWVRRHY
ncbi:glycosyl transferase [Mesorhizobium sp. L103C119B0]|uniref:glycosyltransferase family 2 protein n=1 Tax=Mesorhizobium sp. L103C119B0 TaxID=1287085 RepID=UPI0003CFF7D7|nr:glycosyltransferase family 2 protein [Mesorhizobium sp. L103C119B0]ESZ59946.1 glycosyl transferase [Mesorhizobium sp. L103C119B0]